MKSQTLQIPLSEVSFHPMSRFEDNRLFSWRGELYRGLSHSGPYKDLFQKGIVRTLVDKGLLVETELTDFTLEGYELILKHRRLPFVSYPHEWCGEMLKDAALLVLDLEIELASHGLGLQDSHPWNILFDGCRPIYVDFTSINRFYYDDKSWEMYDQFCHCFLGPLYLIADGHGDFARYLLKDALKGIFRGSLETWLWGKLFAVPDTSPPMAPAMPWTPRFSRIFHVARARLDGRAWLRRCVPSPLRPVLSKILSGLQPLRLYKSRIDMLKRVRKEVESIVITSTKTTWRDPFANDFPPLSSRNANQWAAKHESVFKILSEFKPSSVLDIGGNGGWLAQLAAPLGSTVVSVDADSSSVIQRYRDGKEKHLPVLPLEIDLRSHFPIYGLDDQWLQPAPDRLKCEMVLVLALVHDLVFKQHLSFEQIARAVSALSKRWLLIEFIPREDIVVREWWSQKYSWYTLEDFQEILKWHYRSVSVLSSSPEPRVLLLCEK